MARNPRESRGCAPAYGIGAAGAPDRGPSPSTKDAKPATFLKYESVIPKRELVFDQSEDEVTCFFPFAGSATLGKVASMVQQERYVAAVAMKLRIPQFGYDRFSIPGFYHPSEHSDERARGETGPRSDALDALRRDGQQESLARVFSMYFGMFGGVVQNMPAERRPPDDVVNVLTSQLQASPALVTALRRALPTELRSELRLPCPAARRGKNCFRVLRHLCSAPHPDGAKDLLRQLLTVIDYGVSLPMYGNYVELKQYYESKLPEWQAATKEPEQKYKKAQKALDKFNETAPTEQLPKEELANLAAQQRLITVEEAGVKARIAASEKMLKATPDFRSGGAIASRIQTTMHW